jgi:glycosyltransferase involved in cell wall biosynthesis
MCHKAKEKKKEIPMPFRFHVLGLAHTISTPEYSTCAFTQKVVKLCKLLKAQGHYVIHYGHEDSKVECDEHVTVVKRYDYNKAYGTHDWRKHGWVGYDINKDWTYKVFNTRTPLEVETRRQPSDFLLCSFGFGHKPVADACPELIVVEPGIGYSTGGFAKYRVFESYAIMHAYQGQKAIEFSSNDFWYDAVIPNYFDIADFTYSSSKDDYFLFLGRVNDGKGVHIAEQIAKITGTKLIVAGPGQREHAEGVSYVGVVNPQIRAELLSRATAILCPSTFIEPFCGVQIEAMLSGTPVISSDRGAFSEYNKHGETGFRCKTFEQFTWAARNINRIDPLACRAWGERFTLGRIGLMFDEYFQSVLDISQGKGWYQEKPDRDNLDMTTWRA